jgi:hypothetical protein
MLKSDMVKVAPVLFSRSPAVGMAPQGDNEQFNAAFAKMVAWHNLNHRDEGEYHISRPDVDQLRVESEQRFADMASQSGQEYSRNEQQANWKPPSPL